MERDVPVGEHRGQLRDRAHPNRILFHSSVSLSYSGKNPALKSAGFFVGENPHFPETVEGATGADRFCLATPAEGEANPRSSNWDAVLCAGRPARPRLFDRPDKGVPSVILRLEKAEKYG